MAHSLSDRNSAAAPGRLRERFLGCCAVVLCLASYASSQKTTAGGLSSLLGTNSSKPASTAPAQNSTPSAQAQAPAAIPLPDVAARSEDLKRLLRSVSNQLPSPDQLQSAQAALDKSDAELNFRAKDADAVLAGTPSTMELRQEESFWRNEQVQTADLRRQLLDWANAAQSAMQQVQTQRPLWQATLDQNEHTTGLGPALEVIHQALADLQQLTNQAQNQLKAIVNLQVRAASQDQLALDTLDRVTQARERIDRRLLERDSLPLWQLTRRRQTGENQALYVPASSRLLGISAFADQTKGALIFLFLLLLLSVFGAYRLHAATRYPQVTSARRAEALQVIRRWPALGLLPPLLCSYLLAPIAPLPLIGLVILLSFIPILSLLPALISPRLRLLLYSLAGVYTVSALVAWLQFSPFYKRQVQFLIYAAVFAVFAYLLRPSRMSRVPEAQRSHGEPLLILRTALAILGVSIFANLLGYVRLAQFIGVLCLYSTFIAISMITGVRVFTLLLLEGLDSSAAEQLAVVRCYRDALARWLPRLLQWSGALIWFIVTVNLMGLSTWLRDEITGIFDFHIAGRSSNVTLGGVLGVFLILLVGYAVSSGIRFLLREELLNRLHMARGVPELIASTLHYLLLLLVFLFAVNAGGIELNKFTVLTGALGVGVGFGLQNIVNNFISGLILQFERPIHIGDILDIDGTNGVVTHIGIRSSTIRTYQGAELIIPNGNFISGKVTNWTLTNPQRRVELPVGVAYGSDLKLVVSLLDRAARENENVLTSPAPAVFFMQFGDNAINFELRFWVMQADSTTTVKSEVALAAWALLDEAGVEIPFPQRDLRLRSVDPEAATLLSANDSHKDYSSAEIQLGQPELIRERSKPQRAGE